MDITINKELNIYNPEKSGTGARSDAKEPVTWL